jgi:hypothetical protein
MHIHDEFRTALIAIAIKKADKQLLDRLEVELMLAKKLMPDFSESTKKPKPISYSYINGELIVLWRTPADCEQCDGSGTLTADGATKSFDVDCPACDGSGDSDGDGTDAFTDIDGNVITFDGSVDGFTPMYAEDKKIREYKTELYPPQPRPTCTNTSHHH